MKTTISLYWVLMIASLGVNCEFTSSCLRCIYEARDGQRLLGQCEGGVCGPYLITRPYWEDCGKIGGGYEACTKEKECSETCVKAYMKRYGEYCTKGKIPSCMDYARIHKGGPHGCRDPTTLSFYEKVEECLRA